MCLLSLILTQIAASLIALQPPELAKLIRQHDEDNGTIRAEYSSLPQEQSKDLLSSLRRMQQQFTMEDRIDKAELIQGFLKSYKPKWSVSFGAPGDEKLPASAFKLVLEYRNGWQPAHDSSNRRISELDAKFDATLAKLRNDFAEAGDAVAANAVVEFMKSRKEEIHKSPVEAAEHRLHLSTQRVRNDAEVESRTNARRLLVELREMQSRYESQEDLETALHLRDLLRSLLDESSDWILMHRLRNKRPQLPAEAELAIKAFCEATEAIHQKIADKIKANVLEVDAAMNAEFARILSADDVDAAYSLLTRFQSFRKSHDLPSEGIKLGWDRERPDITTLALSDESRGVVDEFLVSRQKRFDEVDASEQALRDELVGKLNLILMGKNLRPEDRESLTKTIDFLKADYTFGIRGLLLFEVDDELPDEALTAVKQFVEQTTGLREELTAGHQSAVRDLARKQKLVRVKLIQQEEYVRAFGAMASVDLLTPWFEPIAVMADKYSHRRDASIAEVLDVRESEVLLRYQYQSGSKWCPRSNVFYAPGDFPGPRPEEIDLPDEPAPGLSVLPGTRLRPWQQVLATTGVFWKEAKIVDVTLIGIKVRWDGDTSKTHDTVVHRAQLRIPGKPGAQAAIPDAHGILPELLGGTGGAPFRTVSPTGKPVTGIRVTTEEWAGISCIRRIEPHWDRTLENDPITVVAREKYALGAVHVEAEKYVYALKFEFMRIGADGLLNAEDSYVSDWFGTPGRVEVRILTGQGRPVIGFFGRHLAVLDSVGAEFRSSGEK